MGCYNSTVVDGSPADVWAMIRNFHELGWAAGVVETAEKVGDLAGDQLGAKRVLNGVFHETLCALDDVNHIIRYSIDEGPGPLAKGEFSGYIGQVRLRSVSDTGQTFVEWSSKWSTGSSEIKGFCDPIYQALLGAMKAAAAK